MFYIPVCGSSLDRVFGMNRHFFIFDEVQFITCFPFHGPFFALSKTCVPTPWSRYFYCMFSSGSFIVFYIEVCNPPSSNLYVWCEADGQHFPVPPALPPSFSVLFYSYSRTFGGKDVFLSLSNFFIFFIFFLNNLS